MSSNKDNVNILLTEYDVCIQDISQLDTDIWTSSYVFLGISVIGFAILLESQASRWAEFFVYVGTASFGIFLILIWNRLCAAWLKLIHINFYRMCEIENALDMWRERYIQYLDGFIGNNKIKDLPQENPQLKRLKEYFLKRKTITGPPGVGKVLKYTNYLIISGWIFLLIKQAIFLILKEG